MRYIKGGAVTQDTWTKLGDEEPVPAGAAVLVSAARLLGGDAALADAASLGVIWPNNKPVSDLAAHLDRLSLVALVFPTFRDGRAYSQARQLREHYGYTGELRATGNVLRDQFLFMVRAGFDAFEVQKDKDADAFADALREFSVFYQPGADRRTTAFRQRLLDAAAR